jgi:NAD(P)-dependent dehydrogenase (short-subunit alcohol dehydrogenase family)
MGDVIVVTGGGRGIGAATALLAARQGYDVAVTYVSRKDAALDTVAACGACGVKALAVAGELAAESDVMRVFQEVDERLGRLTALVNNAGIVGQQGRLDGFSASRVERMMAVNVVGPILCAREAVRRMSTAHGGAGGAIVNVSSMAAVLGSPGEYVDYAASKAAVDTFTVGLAREVAEEGIRVNAVRPGVIYTEIHASGGEPGRVDRVKATVPMRRGGQPEEVATAIMWLLSSEASYITGAILNISGGR